MRGWRRRLLLFFLRLRRFRLLLVGEYVYFLVSPLFEKTNENGEPFRWRDEYGNEEGRIYLNFVPGPIVDLVNSTSKADAVEKLTQFMLNQASARDRKKKAFQEAVRRHAEKLVEAVRKGKPVLTRVREPLVPKLW